MTNFTVVIDLQIAVKYVTCTFEGVHYITTMLRCSELLINSASLASPLSSCALSSVHFWEELMYAQPNDLLDEMVKCCDYCKKLIQ